MIALFRLLLVATSLGHITRAADAPGSAQSLDRVTAAHGWWRGLDDSQLNDLVEETLSSNPDLKVAAARLRVAEAALDGARAEHRPSLDFGASAQRRAYSRTERKADPFLKDAATALSLGPTASYELDFWGRLSHGTHAAAAEARAAAEDVASLRLDLTGAVADTWIALRANAAEHALLEPRQADARATLAILEARRTSGLSDAQSSALQRAVLADLERESTFLARDRVTLFNRLAALRGLRPEAAPQLQVLPLAATVIDVLPRELTTAVLARRPDLRAAAARLTAQQSRVGAARAAALPSLALSAQGLLNGESIRELLRTGSLGSFIAAQFTVPLLDGGRRAARTESARAELVAATESYTALTIRAFQETADALNHVERARSERSAAEAVLNARHPLLAIAEARHRVGRTDRLAVLTARDAVLVAESDVARARRSELQALVALARALGGEWTAPTPALAKVP